MSLPKWQYRILQNLTPRSPKFTDLVTKITISKDTDIGYLKPWIEAGCTPEIIIVK